MVKEFDEQLFSGFVAALFAFGKEITDDRVEELIMGSSKICYHLSENLIMAIMATKDSPTPQIKVDMNNLMIQFNLQYGPIDVYSLNYETYRDYYHHVDEYYKITPIISKKIEITGSVTLTLESEQSFLETLTEIEELLILEFGPMAKIILSKAKKSSGQSTLEKYDLGPIIAYVLDYISKSEMFDKETISKLNEDLIRIVSRQNKLKIDFQKSLVDKIKNVFIDTIGPLGEEIYAKIQQNGIISLDISDSKEKIDSVVDGIIIDLKQTKLEENVLNDINNKLHLVLLQLLRHSSN